MRPRTSWRWHLTTRFVCIVLVTLAVLVLAFWIGWPAQPPFVDGYQAVAGHTALPAVHLPAMQLSDSGLRSDRAHQESDRTVQLPLVQLCQYCEPLREGVDCVTCDPCVEPAWRDTRLIPWQAFAQGEYVGPSRLPHVPQYRLRVDDLLEFVYRLTREESTRAYELNVGDEIRVESVTDKELNRVLIIQPDGSITLPLLGQVRAAGRTVDELRQSLDGMYERYYKVPSVTVTPIKQNTKLEDLRAAVDSRAGQGGQNRTARVTPEGTIQLPALGSIPAQGLTLEELKYEVDQRYAQVVSGIEVTPVLVQRAPRHVYVMGEVLTPGRFVLEGPTTVLQAIALAGGWRNGGNLRHIVVFRRAEDWHLMATSLDLRGPLLGKRPCPVDEIWLRDSDIVVIPPNALEVSSDFIELVFTRCIYGVIPMQGVSLNFAKASTL